MDINLFEILKDCPKGTKLYSTIHGSVNFIGMNDKDNTYPIEVEVLDDDGFLNTECYATDGRFHHDYNGECVLFPSKEQRDWSKWKCPKLKFDPKILKPFDKVLIRDYNVENWRCDFFSHIIDATFAYKYITIRSSYKYCVPYNDDTKHLVGTTEDAPEFYRYWED